MKKLKNSKRVLSIVLSIALVLSAITISGPGNVNANGSDNLVSNGGFDTTDNWKNTSDRENPVAVATQTQTVEKEVVESIANGDFENAEFNYTSLWGSNAGSLAVVEGAGNRMLMAGSFASEKILYVQSGMTPGETYKIRFKIKGSSNISYHLFCGDTGLSNAAVVQDWQTATTDWTTFEKTYTVPAGNAGHLVIQNVDGSGDLYVDDVSVTTSRTAYTFSEGIGDCNGKEPDKVLVMENMTEVSQAVQLTTGQKYKISFQVKREAGSNTKVALVMDDTEVKAVTPTSEWQEVSGTFTATADSHTLRFKRSGSGKVMIDDVVISETVEMKQIELHFSNYSGGWYFTVDDITNVEEGYYRVPVKIDGGETADIIIEYPKSWYPNGLAIWDFTNFGGTTPTTSFEFAADAVMKPCDGNGVADASRTSVTIKNALKVVKEGESWIEKTDEANPEVTLSLDMVEVDDSWFLNATDLSQATATFYKVATTIDGVAYDVVMEKQGSKFVIWPSFFGIYGGNVPTQSFKIAKDAVISPVTTTDWSVVAGTKLTVKKDFEATKKATGWAEEGGQQTHDTIIVSLGASNGIYNKGTVNEVFSAMISGPTEMKSRNITVKGTINADGTNRESVIWFPGNGECFFYTNGASEEMIVSKNTKFTAADGTEIQFDKNYEIDLQNGLIYEQGKRPEEKKTKDLKIAFDRMVSESFMFSYKLSGGGKPESGFYRTDAVVDGKETQILMEYSANDDAFFIYPNCFNATPVDGKDGYPTKTVELKKGAILTPVNIGSWSTNITGQPYELTAKLSIVKKDGTWMDADYAEEIENIKTLKVKIVFEEVKGRAATVKVVTTDGKSISDIYGDWTTARGKILRGVLDTKTGKYTYTEELGAYSITGDIFYLDGLRLNELDGLQINKGTVLYPDASCKSLVPIEIVNQWRIVRDENDEWVVDKTFTTDYNLNTEQSGNAESNESGDGSNEETVPEEEVRNLTDEAKDDSSYDLSNIVFRGDAQDEVETPAAVQTTSMSLWVMILAAAVLLILVGSGLFLVIKGKKKNVKREE